MIGYIHIENIDTEAETDNFLEEELIEEGNVTMEDTDGSGSGDGEQLEAENDRQETSKDELGGQDHEDAISINVPRDHKSKKSPGNNLHSTTKDSTSSGWCMIIPKKFYLIILLLFIR